MNLRLLDLWPGTRLISTLAKVNSLSFNSLSLKKHSVPGEFSSSSFSISDKYLIFAERGGQRVERVEKYWLEVEEAGRRLRLERDWMKTWPCKLSYNNTG